MYSTNQFSVMRTCYDLCRNIFTSTNSSSHSSVNKYNGHGFKYNRAVEQVILLYNIITYRLNCLMPAYSYGCQNCLFFSLVDLSHANNILYESQLATLTSDEPIT